MEQVNKQRAAALRIPEDLFMVGQPFTRNELGALVHRGLLRETMGGCFLRTDHPYDPTVRTRIAAYLAGSRMAPGDVLCRLTAAWIHGLLPHSSVLCISSDEYHRPYALPEGPTFDFVRLSFRDDEIQYRHGVLVTTLLRTVCDVACLDEIHVAADVLRRVRVLGDRFLSLDAVATALEGRTDHPSVRRGLRLVESYQLRAA